MIHLTDKQRCELSFIGRLIYVLILGGVTGVNQQELADAALQVAEEPFIGISDPQKLKRRVMRMEQNTILPLAGKAHGEKVVLICYYFINTLANSEKLIIPEGSHLAIVVEFLLSLIDTENEVVQKRMVSAEKQAKKWLMLLNEDGYYR